MGGNELSGTSPRCALSEAGAVLRATGTSPCFSAAPPARYSTWDPGDIAAIPAAATFAADTPGGGHLTVYRSGPTWAWPPRLLSTVVAPECPTSLGTGFRSPRVKPSNGNQNATPANF